MVPIKKISENEAKKGSGHKPTYALIGILVFPVCCCDDLSDGHQLSETSELVKNISIVLFAFTAVLGTIASIILIVQFATLINLLKNEIKPVLKTTRETVNNVKGTVSFMGDKMVSPVIETNAKIAGVHRIISILIRMKRKNRRLSCRNTMDLDLLSGFLIGAIAGAVATILYAPQTGDETRKILRDKREELWKRLLNELLTKPINRLKMLPKTRGISSTCWHPRPGVKLRNWLKKVIRSMKNRRTKLKAQQESGRRIGY